MTGRLLPIIFLSAVCVLLAGCGKDSVQVELPKLKNSIDMELVLIPAGEFQMGSNNHYLWRREAGHTVKINKPFYLAATEVTQAQYKAVMSKNPPWSRDLNGKDLPVENVKWTDAVEFCKKLSAKENKTYRLPTDAEWEYACRAGTKTTYSFGDSEKDLGDYAWYWTNSDKKTHPVGKKKPNAWGLYDMHGNVMEWCFDWRGGRSQKWRGGAWNYSAFDCRSTFVWAIGSPDGTFMGGGFRVALSVQVESPDPFQVVSTEAAETNKIKYLKGMEMVLIPAGEFQMGSDNGKINEEPVHTVKITKPFYLSATEVTQAQYEEVMGENPVTRMFKGNDLPVGRVDPSNAVEFCKRLSGGGKTYRLPTEAEWEYACRAGTKTVYSFGDSEKDLGDYAWYKDDSTGIFQPVGMKKPNAWGLYDMHGNVQELCSEGNRKYSTETAIDPTGPTTGVRWRDRFVRRGGGRGSSAWSCRSAFRTGTFEMGSYNYVGFRLALSVHVEFPVMKMVLIPAGEFQMGSDNGEDDEKPVHTVKITKPFFMSATEVTQAQYEAVMGKNPSRFKFSGKDMPVEGVMWEDAVEFCNKLSAKEKKTYRLPTEAEWEYACRAGTKTKYCFEDSENDLRDYAWYGDKAFATKAYRKVNKWGVRLTGKKKPNAWGLYDMHGNVMEWCEDWYRDSYEGAPTDGTAITNDAHAKKRVLRGGSWQNPARDCRSADRYATNPRGKANWIGFRCVIRD